MAEAPAIAVGGLDMGGAFMEKLELLPPAPVAGASEPPLSGLTFAVKDIFDIEGRVTGFGNPDWARTHGPAASTAPAVLALLAAGATCVGVTVMDELAYSINGQNYHYGTPTNPCASDRVPGGSSSGSAVAVGAGHSDFSLGTDTGGSVRVPASYCGIFGFRPSHGVVPTTNVTPMAQSFDTVGWFARDVSTLSKVGKVLLPLSIGTAKQPDHIVIPKDCFEILSPQDDQLYHIISVAAERTYGDIIEHKNLGDFIRSNVPSIENSLVSISNSKPGNIPALVSIAYAMQQLQRSEFKANHADWVNTVKPNICPGIRQRVMLAMTSNYDDLDHCLAVKHEFRAALPAFLQDNGILAIPTVPAAPPKLNMDPTDLQEFREKAFSLLSIAGLSGFCQVTIPLGVRNLLPVSVSLLAQQGSDHFLLNVAEEMCDALREAARTAWSLSG